MPAFRPPECHEYIVGICCLIVFIQPERGKRFSEIADSFPTAPNALDKSSQNSEKL